MTAAQTAVNSIAMSTAENCTSSTVTVVVLVDPRGVVLKKSRCVGTAVDGLAIAINKENARNLTPMIIENTKANVDRANDSNKSGELVILGRLNHVSVLSSTARLFL